MEYELKDIGFLQAPVIVTKPVHKNTGKHSPKRKHVKKGRRTMVGTRLTAEQMGKLEGLVSYYTEANGAQATVASVLAELVDKADVSAINGEVG